jgi:hypothetical protein
MITRTRIHVIADTLGNSLKLSELDCLAIAPHLVGGKRVNLGDIAWLTLTDDKIVIIPRKKPGTDDGGDFETIVPLPENSLDTEFVGRLMEGGTDDPGYSLNCSDPLTRSKLL